MIKRNATMAATRCTVLLTLVLALGACADSDGNDYCKNHYKIHADHVASLATLTLQISDSGEFKGRVRIPRAAFGDMSEERVGEVLGNAGNVFLLETDIPCLVAVDHVTPGAAGLDASYSAQCGSGNKLGRVDVALLNHISDINEVLASVTTPATQKRFEIGRQCDSPIFRLD